MDGVVLTSMHRTRIILCFLLFSLAPLTAQRTDHVVLVIIDGARYSETFGDSTGRYIPRMKALSALGAVVDTFLNDGVTVTNRGVPAIWTGSWSVPVPSGSTQYMLEPSVWEYYRKDSGADTTQAMYIMKYLTTPWLQSYHAEYGPAYWPWYMLQGSTDADVCANAVQKIGTYHPALCVVYLADVDHEGHSGVWDNYVRAISTADSLVGVLWDFVQSDAALKDRTTMIVTNDHGRHLDGIANGFAGHGDACQGCRRILLLAVGTGIRQAAAVPGPRTIPDIVPTVGTLLGFSTPYVTGTPMSELFTTTSAEPSPDVPSGFALQQNFPNPFNPSTTFRFSVPVKSRVRLTVHDILGRTVAVVFDGSCDPGNRMVSWRTDVAAGVYFYRMDSFGLQGSPGRYSETRKLLIVR